MILPAARLSRCTLLYTLQRTHNICTYHTFITVHARVLKIVEGYITWYRPVYMYIVSARSPFVILNTWYGSLKLVEMNIISSHSDLKSSVRTNSEFRRNIMTLMMRCILYVVYVWDTEWNTIHNVIRLYVKSEPINNIRNIFKHI